MSVTDVGIPSLQTSSGTGSPKTQAGAWGTGQNRTAGNLLVALVTATGSTSAGAITENTTQGWNKIFEGAGSTSRAAIFTKPALGSDTAPTFKATLSGTSSHSEISVELYELNDSTGNLPELDVGNSASGTSGTETITTVGNVAGSGEFALAVQAMIASSSSSNTWGTVSGWTNVNTDGATAFSHFVSAKESGPSSGSTLSYNPTHSQTSIGIAGAIAVFKPGRYAMGTTIQITATPTGGTGHILRVYALTNALESGGAIAHHGGASTISLTPNGSHSQVFMGLTDFFGPTSFTPVDANSQVVDNINPSGVRAGTVNYIGTVTAGSAVVPGVTNVDGNSAYLIAAQEILSADGSNIPPIDASSPPVVSDTSGTASAKTTALFAPPADSVLLAICVSGNNTGTAWTISDTAGLTWTKGADNTGQRFYTATVPTTGDSGTGSVAMHKMGLAGSGIETEFGTGSVTMHKMGLSGSGQETDTGAGSVQMHKMGLSGSGLATGIATGSVAMHKMGLSGSGQETDAGTGSVAMHKMDLSGSGVSKLESSGSVAMHKMGLAGSGIETEFGDGSVAMHKMGLSGSGQETDAGTGSVAMHKMGLSGAGTESGTLSGSGSVQMHKMGLSGSGQETDAGTGSVQMHKMGLSASGNIVGSFGSVAMHKMDLSGAGRETVSGPLHISMHKMDLHGTGVLTVHAIGSVRMHKMGISGTDVHTKSSPLFIFTPV